jgi:hypothetical protein
MKQNVTRRGLLDHPLFEIRKSPIQGRGAFAKRRIRAGQKIVEYTGEKISNDEADKRYDEEKMPRHHTFLFTLDDDYCIDGNVRSNIARLINHSCDPNCEALIEDDRIWIYALKNIQPGVELAHRRRHKKAGEVLRLPLRVAEMPRKHHGAAKEAKEKTRREVTSIDEPV